MPKGVYKRTEQNSNKGKTGGHLSQETIAKIKSKRALQVITQEHKDNISKGNLGRKFSKETCEKISKALSGRKTGPRSEETKQKLREANLGKKLSPEHIKKISEANSGKKRTKEQKLKHSEMMMGRKLSPEHIAALVKSNKGRVASPETKQKLREAFTGEKSVHWKGGVTTENMRLRKLPEYKEWRKSVFERDNFTCQISCVTGGDLEAHHIESFSDNKDKIFNTDNGITLSKDIHKMFHKQYGLGNNTREQLNEFIKNYADTDKINISGRTESDTGTEVAGQSGVTEIDTRVESELLS